MLNKEESSVINDKGTEKAFSGKYNKHYENGIYTCKKCDNALFYSSSKFDSKSGWPSFDNTIPGAVKEIPDKDGRRVEIVCAICKGHLGHVFKGENFTNQNTRHCVNSISLNFIPKEHLKKAIFASGCFWGTEYFLQKASGVISTTVGYIGGHVDSPTYKQVCEKKTGHAEAVEVYFDSKKTNFETLCKLFFETHDPTQINRQGPDIGTQYRSEIFYIDDEQKSIAEKLVKQLENKNFTIATKITKATVFWPAETDHQNWYIHKKTLPYCHLYKKKFD